jgi:predicted transcriptional regulator
MLIEIDDLSLAGAFSYDANKVAGQWRRSAVLHSQQMGNTISVRLPADLAAWLDENARKTGMARGRIIREELEKARRSEARPFLRLAGAGTGPADLSSCKGFSRK